jgi:exodeoxyribonuclease VII small subunit
MPTKKEEVTPDVQRPIEKDIEELELIVRQLDEESVALEDSIALFEKGMALSEATRKRLTEFETRVELLTKRGNAITPESFGK